MNQWGTGISIRLSLNFNQAGIDISMILSLTLGHAKLRGNQSQNEQLWHTLDISNVFEPTFGLKDSH